MAKQLTVSELEQAATTAFEQFSALQDHGFITIDGARIELTHLAKPMWQASPEHPDRPNITKRDIISYYLKSAVRILPYLQDRPITVKRFPDGVDGQSFIQRHFDDLPEYVKTVELCVDSDGNNAHFVLCQNLPSLVWLANQDVVEFHPWHSRINPEDTTLPTIFINSLGTLEMSVLNYPDWLVIDLDPSPELTEGQSSFEQLLPATSQVHEYLDSLGLTHFAKLSGQRGLHIMLPIHRKYPYDVVRKAAQRLSEQLAERHPDNFSTEWNVELRQGKIFIDWLQNSRAKSICAAYSLRSSEQASVSLPIRWDQFENLNSKTSSLETISRSFSTIAPDFYDQLFKQAQDLPESLLS